MDSDRYLMVQQSKLIWSCSSPGQYDLPLPTFLLAMVSKQATSLCDLFFLTSDSVP